MHNVVSIESAEVPECTHEDLEGHQKCPVMLKFEEDKSVQRTTIVVGKASLTIKVKDQQETFPSELESIVVKLMEKRGWLIGH